MSRQNPKTLGDLGLRTVSAFGLVFMWRRNFVATMAKLEPHEFDRFGQMMARVYRAREFGPVSIMWRRKSCPD